MKSLQKKGRKRISIFLVLLILLQCSVFSFASVPQEFSKQETVKQETVESESIDKIEEKLEESSSEKLQIETTSLKIEDESTKDGSTQDSSKVNEKEEEESTSSVEETKESESELIEDSEEMDETSKKSGDYEEEPEEIESSSIELENDIDKNDLIENELSQKNIFNEKEEEAVALDVEKGNCKITNEAKLKKAVIASQSEAEIEEEIKIKKTEKEIPIATPNTLTFKAPANANYLTFTANEANSTIKLKWKSGSNVQTSTDGGSTWTNYTAGDLITLINIGDTVSFKGKDVCTEYDALDSTKQNIFTMTGSISASGDVTSLTNEVGGDVTLTENCYYYMFYNCEALITAPNLPSTSLAKECYCGMFMECSNLTTAPVLPATTLANSCYVYMFHCCSSLTKAPTLPATTLAKSCYTNMFNGCRSLTETPELPATVMEQDCYACMFDLCIELTKIPKLPATILANGCYCSMFAHCPNIILRYEFGGKAVKKWEIPSTASFAPDWNLNMFMHCPNVDLDGQGKKDPDIGSIYYTKGDYKVTLNPYGHGTPSTIELWAVDGEKISQPKKPSEAGWKFEGWHKDSTCLNKWDFETDVVTADTTLYAKWTPINYTISYTINEGIWATGYMPPNQYTIDDEIILPNANKISKKDCTFGGWYNNATFSGGIVAKIPKGSTGDKTFYAKWNKNETPTPKPTPSGGGSSSGGGGGGLGSVSSVQIVNGQVIATAAPTSQVVAISKTAATTQTINAQTQGAKWVKDPVSGKWMLAFINKKGKADIAKLGFIALASTNAKNQLNTSTYFFNEAGQMQTGWVTTADGKKYFFDNAKTQDEGKMAVGWKQVQSDWHFFQADGSLLKGGLTADGYVIDADGKWVNQANIAQAVQNVEIAAAGGYAIANKGA